MKKSPTLELNNTISAVSWTDKSICQDYLHHIMQVTQSPSLSVAASQFSKKYARLIVVPALSLMTIEDKALDVSIENCLLDMGGSDGKWNPSLQFVNAAENCRTTGSRQSWRKQIIETLFAEHLNEIWKTLSSVSGVSMAVLWENTAVRTYSLYEKKLRKNATVLEQARIDEDFYFLIHEAPGKLFGAKRNPLQYFYTEKGSHSPTDNPVRVRHTCCFYYQTGAGGKYCGVCPKKTCNVE
ncbi:IucA/IucC family C-terminal-domain containing protein [Alteribacillus sp. YIM 98480]|uniref:IucA/IucC family C-terminal-domain containing protein n=1 Tax=Alteribacillus sp. YIM 98480 TaxID=2606599 RepID=UPI00131C751D|nr:IucA/IucC family C-terminal-domain containing protein [Alteribacillus sp. YIM 98480]